MTHGRGVDAISEAYSYCEALLRRDDPDRWLASLFVPASARPHVHALYAFNLEIARVREIVSEPLLGEMRFQWWRDALESAEAGDVTANPVAAALIATIDRFQLPKPALLDLIEARLFDLYDDQMETVAALEAYARATTSILFRLTTRVIDPQHAVEGLGVADHAGIAYAVTGLLRALPWHRARGQSYVPVESLGAHGGSPGDFTAEPAAPALRAALADLRALVRSHLEIFAARLPCVPDQSRPAYLAAALCEDYLRQMEKRGYDPFTTLVVLPQWRRQWILWRAARRWR
jgi:phytoene synthase